GEARLVLGHWGYEPVGIPGEACGLGRQVGDIVAPEFVGQGEDVLGRVAAAVDHHHGGRGLSDRCSGADHRLPLVGTGGAPPSAPAAAFSAAERTSMGGRTPWICLREASSHGGSLRVEPRLSTGSSRVKPGGSVAISKSTPPGSRK